MYGSPRCGRLAVRPFAPLAGDVHQHLRLAIRRLIAIADLDLEAVLCTIAEQRPGLRIVGIDPGHHLQQFVERRGSRRCFNLELHHDLDLDAATGPFTQ